MQLFAITAPCGKSQHIIFLWESAAQKDDARLLMFKIHLRPFDSGRGSDRTPAARWEQNSYSVASH